MIHLSDIHNDPSFLHICRNLAEFHEPEPVMITGDLSNNGDELELLYVAACIEILRGSGHRVMVCPGNHDERILGNFESSESRKNWEAHISKDPYPQRWIIEGVTYIMLDSTETSNEFSATGRIGKRQLETLDILLSDSEPPIIVGLHHRPLMTPGMMSHLMKLHDGFDLMQMVKGRVAAVCYGHQHDSRVDIVDGIQYYSCGKTTDPVDGQYRFRRISPDSWEWVVD